MIRWTLVAALLLATGPLAADDEAQLAAEYEAEIREATGVGRALFEHATAQQVAAAAARRVRGFRRDREVLGMLSTRVEDRIEVEFVGTGGDGAPEARYRALVDLQGQLLQAPQALTQPEPLTPERARAFDVRQRAAHYPFERCSEDLAVVVLPDPSGTEGALLAYTLATPARQSVAVGGNFRIHVAADDAITAARGFTNTCIQLQLDPRAAALMVSHLLDPHPTEIHVFASLQAGKPLFLATTENRGLWSVEGDTVRQVGLAGEPK